MVSHHPAKFSGHRHYGSGNIVFLVVEEQDPNPCFNHHQCLSLKHMTRHALIHEISGRRHSYLQCVYEVQSVLVTCVYGDN